MKLLPALAVIAVLCLIATIPAAVTAQSACPPPTEITLTPHSGVPGDTVTITGAHCGDRMWVDIYYGGTQIEETLTNSVGRFTIDITIPESPRGKHEVLAVVVIERVTYEARAYFDVRPGLTVSPRKGPPGTEVTVTGRGFVADETVLDVRYYHPGSYETVAKNIAVAADGTWEATFEVPASTRGEHKIDAWGSQTIRASVRHAIFELIPGITVDVTSGSVGQTITMKGSGFAPNETNIRILLDGRAVRTGITADFKGDWHSSFEVPEKPRDTYMVTAEGDSTWRGQVGDISFGVGPGIMLSPQEGHVGMELTVTGRGFAASKNVAIVYDGSQVETVRTDEDGRFDMSFAVPESASGDRTVKAIAADDPNGTADTGPNVSAVFTMESEPPPIPEPVFPTGRVGVLYKATPTFEWSRVSDPSGVYYSLQMSASKELTGGKLIDPIVSKEGLTVTSYALETEALPYGRYYWIVRAVDGAGNESPWSEVHSFRAGLMPRWAFIVAAVVLGIILLALIRVAIIRRTYYY